MFVLEALTVCSLVAVIIVTARRDVPAWKGHALAAMFHGLSSSQEGPTDAGTFAFSDSISGVHEDGGIKATGRSLEKTRDMEIFADTVKVRLAKDNVGRSRLRRPADLYSSEGSGE